MYRWCWDLFLLTLLVSACAKPAHHQDIAAAPVGAKMIFEDGEGPVRVSDSVKTQPVASAGSMRAGSPASVRKQPYMGLLYWISLVGNDGHMQQVPVSRNFKGGDSIKIHIMSNRSGYLHLINAGSTGHSNVLFPYNDSDNYIHANTPYVIPKDARIRFDSNPGQEVMWAILSPSPFVRGSPSRYAAGGVHSEMVGSPPGCKDLALYVDYDPARAAERCGSKDLIIEESSYGEGPARYAVAPVSALHHGDQVIALPIILRHR